MTPEIFVNKFYPFALESEKETGIPAIASLSMAALESFWGKKAIGNNLFGIKYRKGDWGYQKVLTTEYDKNKNAYNGQETKSIKYNYDKKLYEFKVWQYFANFETPKDAFLAHSKLLLTDRYKTALRWKYSPVRYLVEVWKLGYATDPEYDTKIGNMVKSVERRIPKNAREVVRAMNIIKRIEPGRLTGDIEKKTELEEKLKNRIK